MTTTRQILDGTGTAFYVQGNGAGTSGDPFIPIHTNGLNDGIDIGDVTVNNAAGAAVYVQPGTSATFAPAATESHLGEVGGNTYIVSANFTRPANTTAYASGNLVANSTTAGSVTPMALSISRLTDKTFAALRLRLKKSNTSLTNAQFRVHLYRNSPTLSNGDGAAWLTTESGYLGYFDVTMTQAFSDAAKGFGVPNAGSQILTFPSGGTTNIFALIEARAAYTPASSEVFTVELETSRD